MASPISPSDSEKMQVKIDFEIHYSDSKKSTIANIAKHITNGFEKQKLFCESQRLFSDLAIYGASNMERILQDFDAGVKLIGATPALCSHPSPNLQIS